VTEQAFLQGFVMGQPLGFELEELRAQV